MLNNNLKHSYSLSSFGLQHELIPAHSLLQTHHPGAEEGQRAVPQLVYLKMWQGGGPSGGGAASKGSGVSSLLSALPGSEEVDGGGMILF